MPSKKVDFQLMKKQSEEYYDSLDQVYCPYFAQDVYFDARGFHHLFYKGNRSRKKRQKAQTFARLKILYLAPKLLSIATFVQEFQEVSNVKYWGFIAILEGKKIKLVVRQTNNSRLHFWSIFPNWVTRKKSDKKISTC